MKKEQPRTLRIELTDDQKKKVRDQLGEDLDTVELKVDEGLEDRISPTSVGTFF